MSWFRKIRNAIGNALIAHADREDERERKKQKNIRGKKMVQGANRSAVWASLIVFFSLLSAGLLFWTLNKESVVILGSSVFATFFLSLLTYPYFPRKCPSCGKRMKGDYAGGAMPENYYCQECGVYQPTGLKNDDQERRLRGAWANNPVIRLFFPNLLVKSTIMRKTFTLICTLAVAAFGIMAFRFADITAIEIGTKLPRADVKLKDVMTDKETTLSGAAKDKGLLVIFSCNTCPFVIANEARIKEHAELAMKNGIGVVIVNSNEAYRSEEDSPEAMKKYGEKQGFTCAYVIDPKSEVADAFGATRTPECFLFDKSNALVYHGAIDDNPKDPAAVTARYLKDAVEALGAGKEVKVKTSRSLGCTIKRKDH